MTSSPLAKHNVTAIALDDSGGWPGLMYLEYFTDRIGGPQVFVNIQNRQKGAWSNPAIIQALKDIQTLVKDNAFEQGYQDISFGTGFTEAMIHNGVAAMELMGDWDIGFIQGYYPGWVATGDMGIGFFPTVPGGKGNPADLEGNTTDLCSSWLRTSRLPRPTLRRSSRPCCAPPRLTRSSRSAKVLYPSSPARPPCSPLPR